MPRNNKIEIKSNKKNYKKGRNDPDSSDSETEYSDVSDEYSTCSSSEIETPKKSNKKKSRGFDDELHQVLDKLMSKKSSNKKKSKKIATPEESEESESESEYEDVDEDEDEEEDDEDYTEEDADADEGKGNLKFTFTIGGGQGLVRNKFASNETNDEYGTDDEKTFMRENYDAELEPVGLMLSESFESLEKASKKKSSKKEDTESVCESVDIEDKYKEIIDLKRVLVQKLKANNNNKIVQKALKQCNKSIQKLIKNARSKNAEAYEDLLYAGDGQDPDDELGYFKKKLSNKEQLKIMEDLRTMNKHMYVEKPYRLSLLQSSMPAKFKAIAMQRLNQLSMMEPGEPEYFKLKNWVDNFMRIPFGQYKSLTVNINDGLERCSEYIKFAKSQLDKCAYGLNDAKMQIMQMVGQWMSNPGSMGTAIAIHGPPGTSKTNLVKEGISKILGRDFAFIALGGCGDSSFLEGHSYTYEGSTWGKIVQILIESKSMNPVIYFDELDKVSDTARGQEIIGILTHLTDTTQNSQFHDKYFSEIDLDLSKCLFIFSYNDENLVNPILRDRMYKIATKGYDVKEKIIIARDYMLPKIREQVGFKEDEVLISDEILTHIINNQAKGEEGVRNLKRTLEIIHTKLNLYRLVKPEDAGIFEKDLGLKVTFPYTLTKTAVDSLVKVNDTINKSVLYSLYV